MDIDGMIAAALGFPKAQYTAVERTGHRAARTARKVAALHC